MITYCVCKAITSSPSQAPPLSGNVSEKIQIEPRYRNPKKERNVVYHDLPLIFLV